MTSRTAKPPVDVRICYLVFILVYDITVKKAPHLYPTGLYVCKSGVHCKVCSHYIQHHGTNSWFQIGDSTINNLRYELWTTYVMLLTEKQEAQLMLTTGSTRLAVSRGQQTWYHSTCYI